MARIGVCTFKNNNYGTSLQAFALQKKLVELGAEPYILQVDTPVPKQKRNILKLLKRNPYYGRLTQYRLKKSQAYFTEKNAKIEVFWKQMNIVRCSSYSDVFKEVEKTDAFITGSDQLWNPNGPIRREFLLNFECLTSVPKFSYAVSLGVNTISADQGRMLANFINDFTAVSLRERSGETCLHVYINKKTRVDIDPTLLFDGSFWSQKCQHYAAKDEKYIFVYMLRPDENTLQAARLLSKKTGMKIYYTGNLAINDPGIAFVKDAGVEEFLGLIKHAAYVVTNSFHGTAFSVQFHKKVLSIKLDGTGDRAREFLEMIGLEHLLIDKKDIDSSVTSIIENDIDYSGADVILANKRKDSEAYIVSIVMEAENYKSKHTFKYIDVYRQFNCSGCAACISACPCRAIDMKTGADGFRYASINMKKCVECGKCVKVCPMQSPHEKGKPKKSYAAVMKDKSEVKKSTSGGIFFTIARNYIGSGGVVYGAAMSNDNGDLSVRHIRAETIDEVNKCRGTKYIQSKTDGIYEKVQEDIEKGRKVLFSGTPCQVSALKNYLGRDYDNMLTIDIVCHGVPSQEMFNGFLQEYEKRNAKRVLSFDFRSKIHGWCCEHVAVTEEDRNIRYYYTYTLSYLYFFLKSFIYRDSCYRCPYAGCERTSDLTIGDFWGVELTYPELLKKKEFSDKDGISCVLCCTEKGLQTISSVKDGLVLAEVDYVKVSKYNGSLRKPCDPPLGRRSLFEVYEKRGYGSVEKLYEEKSRGMKSRYKRITISPYLYLHYEKKLKRAAVKIRNFIRVS